MTTIDSTGCGFSADRHQVHTLLAELPGRHAPLVRHAEIAVSEHAIRVWCSAIGESNPIHRDREAALAAGFDGVVAPAAMLQTWTMPISRTAGEVSPTLHSAVRARARDASFAHVVATDYVQEYTRPVVPGDLLVEHSWIEHVSGVKSTRLGRGVFVTIGLRIQTHAGEDVGIMRSRTFYFTPPDELVERPATPSTPTGAGTGETLPSLAVPLDRALVIASALASNDHELVHLDHTRAQDHGLPDIITSIVTTAGLALRYAGDQLPRGSWCTSLRLTLAQPAHPGDTLHLGGHREATNGCALSVMASHTRGIHATASLTYRDIARSPRRS